jgi:hypothetical protein
MLITESRFEIRPFRLRGDSHHVPPCARLMDSEIAQCRAGEWNVSKSCVLQMMELADSSSGIGDRG